jgi:hypothetical protein
MDKPSANAIGIVVVGVFLYFVPSIVGWRKPNASSIIAVNIFLGWTVIGWVIALVWATHEAKPSVIVSQQPIPPPAGLLCSSCRGYSGFGSRFCSHCGALLSTPLQERSA